MVAVLALTAPLPLRGPLQLAAHQLLQWVFPNVSTHGAISLPDTSSLSRTLQGSQRPWNDGQSRTRKGCGRGLNRGRGAPTEKLRDPRSLSLFFFLLNPSGLLETRPLSGSTTMACPKSSLRTCLGPGPPHFGFGQAFTLSQKGR